MELVLKGTGILNVDGDSIQTADNVSLLSFSLTQNYRRLALFCIKIISLNPRVITHSSS